MFNVGVSPFWQMTIAFGVFLITFGFGNAVERGAFRAKSWRPVHHILYFAVMATAVWGAVSGFFIAFWWGALVSIMVAILFGMTRFRGGSQNHRRYGYFSLGMYALLYLITIYSYGTH